MLNTKQTGRILAGAVFTVCFAAFSSPVWAMGNFVIKNISVDDSGKIIMMTGKTPKERVLLKPVSPVSADKMYVDITNAVLNSQKSSFDIAGTDIKSVKAYQYSVKPAVTRLMFTGNVQSFYKKLQYKQAKDVLFVKFEDSSSVSPYTPVVYDELQGDSSKQDPVLPKDYSHNYYINNIRQLNNRVDISGIGNVTLKEPIILSNPTRIVYDLNNSALISRDLIKSAQLNSADSIRIAQFDPRTVRIVIETETPDNYKTILSPDAQSLVIAKIDSLKLQDLPEGKNVGLIQGISAEKKDQQTTVLTFKTTKPVVHQIRRFYSKDIISLELYNINAPAKTMLTKLQKTDQFKGINIESIDKFPYGSEWNISIGRNSRVQSKISADGKKIELAIKDNTYIPIRHIGEFKNKVVIDAGHGGTEPGAQRANYMEKDITISVARKVKQDLLAAGINVVMTRENDETVSLKDRTVITNNENPDLFVSIHVNSCESPVATGLETHWFTPQSRALAQIIQDKLIHSSIQSPNRGIMNSMFYVIHHTDVPSVLVEIGFISNDNERIQLLTDGRQEVTAKAISDGIIEFLKKAKDN